MKKEIKDILSTLPHSAGIYQFFNAKWEIIYIGKSKNLKSRVSSYFSGDCKLNFAKKKMIWYITDIKYIVTNNETESLILENSLIKEHQPKYNILLKDDKNFLYIKITRSEYPQVVKTRISPANIKKNDGKYFWPYISGYYVSEILKLLKKVFWYGVGNNNFFKKKGAYSLDKYIFDGDSRKSEQEQRKIYLEKIDEMSKFLSGNTGDVKEKLKKEMLEMAEKMQFEEAAKRKVQIEAIESLDTLQVVRDGVKWDFIVLQVLEKFDKTYLWAIDIKDSKVTGYENYEVRNELWETAEEVLRDVIGQKWVENRHRKWLSFILPEAHDTESIADDIVYEVPQIGVKFELLKLCYKNIYEYAHKKHIDSLSTKSFSKQTMQNLLELLGYDEINKDIIFECNDISHLSGTHTVASRSVIENGKKNPKKYKKFRVKTLDQGKIDDFWSMEEIMIRRIAELEKIKNYPDLIVIDGGKWQLWAVMKIIEASKLSPIPQIVSIAKKEEELFLPNQSESILLEKQSNELRLIQALRDEAHRFAISFNRDSRSSTNKKNILESIPGIGPKTRKKILTTFWSVDGLKKAPSEEIKKLLGNSVYENLENHWLV